MNKIFYQDYENFLVDRASPEIIEYEKLWSGEKIPLNIPFNNTETKKIDPIFLVGHKMTKSTPFHSHNFYEIIYILHGLVENHTGDLSFYMGGGDICIMNLASSHLLNTLDSEAIVFNICISTEEMQSGTYKSLYQSDNFIGNFLRENVNLEYLYFPNNGRNNLSEIIQAILTTRAKDATSMPFYLASHVFKLFAELLDLNEYSYLGIDNVVMEILQYVKINCSTTSLSDVATHFNYSESYPSKMITKHTGRPLNKIITGYKIEEACLLLINSDLSVNDIANNVGYKSYSHFHKLFKTWLKVTPNAYRMQFER